MNAQQRILQDITALMAENFTVQQVLTPDGVAYVVDFYGPLDTPYGGYIWKVEAKMSTQYPRDPPDLRFITRVYHPNIGSTNGLVCMDVLAEKWEEHNDLVHIFKFFLPLLFREPNPWDPMNCAASRLFKQDKATYDLTVKEFCKNHALTPEDLVP